MKQWLDDIFIIDQSGIPFWSYCYGGENCKRYPDHVLQTGMLAAFFQFGQEFGQKIVERVQFDTGNFFFFYDKPIITVFATASDVDPEVVKEKVMKATDLFKGHFSDKIEGLTLVDPADFAVMGDLLQEKGIVDYEPKMPLTKSFKKKKWWQRFFG
ncbi:MAG: hypothetical protein ACFFD4_03665 [Candidatus Odinarchaeota archaeon]